MNVLIVEDEALAAERLTHLLKKYDREIQVVDEVDTVKRAVDALEKHNDIDLLFLDIQLSDGKSFEIFDKVPYEGPVIFTTAYDRYSLRAFEWHSIDYLLKPLTYEALETALNKYKKIHATGHMSPINLEALKSLIARDDEKYKKRFIVKFGANLHFKPVEDIACFYADGKIVYLHLKETHRKFILDHSLEELESHLLNPADFFRISRKVIVRLDAITGLKSYPGNRLEVKLSNGLDAPLVVSRERVAAFKEWINS
jgi:DNA-binding LytR/AlgR family response regulator